MTEQIYDRLNSFFERRFLKNAFLPVALFIPAIVAPILLQGDRLSRLIKAWDGLPTSSKLLAVVGYLALGWFCAAIVASQWGNIIRLFEGYPLMELPWLYNLGRLWHQERLAQLVEIDTARSGFVQHWAYPQMDDVLPTRLGNVLRAGEAEAKYRYGADLIILWPLLYHVLPRAAIDDIADARATVEFLLVLSLWCCGFSVANPLLAIALSGSLVIAALMFVGGMTLAYLAYLAAIAATSEYSAFLWSTFELHRFVLLAQLRIRIPDEFAKEQQIWKNLCEFVLKGKSPPEQYDPGVSEQVIRIGGIQSPHGRR